MNSWKWIVGHRALLLRILFYTLAAGLALVVIGIQREQIADLAEARPLALAVGTAVICLLAGLSLAWRFRAPEKYRDVAVTGFVMLIALGFGAYMVSVSAAYADEGLKIAAVRTMTGWAAAYFAGGFFVGFLFGIPRVLQGNNGSSGSQPSPGVAARYEQRVNTNLEQISDWLTKIIVGLGLVELRTMPERIYTASLWMAQSISVKESVALDQVASFACAFIIFFSIVGFLAGYLLTRLFLAGAFWRADNVDRREGESSVFKSLMAGGGGGEASAQQGERIRAFWKPNNILDPEADQKIKNWLRSKGLDVSVPLLISGEFAKKRADLIRDLNIPEIST